MKAQTPAQLAFSFPCSHSSKLTSDKDLNTFIFLSGSSLTQLWCCKKFPFIPAWRGSQRWMAGAATPPCFFGWMEQGMPCSTALAVLQVACKAPQLAPQGLSMYFTVPLITNIYLLLQHTNRAAIYQVYTGDEITEYRCAENWRRRKELFLKSPDLSDTQIFLGAVWYLLFAVLKQQCTLGTLGTSHLSCLPPKPFSVYC